MIYIVSWSIHTSAYLFCAFCWIYQRSIRIQLRVEETSLHIPRLYLHLFSMAASADNTVLFIYIHCMCVQRQFCGSSGYTGEASMYAQRSHSSRLWDLQGRLWAFDLVEVCLQRAQQEFDELHRILLVASPELCRLVLHLRFLWCGTTVAKKIKSISRHHPWSIKHEHLKSRNHHPSSIIDQPSSINHHPSSVIRHPSIAIHPPASKIHQSSSRIHHPSSMNHNLSSIVHQTGYISDDRKKKGVLFDAVLCISKESWKTWSILLQKMLRMVCSDLQRSSGLLNWVACRKTNCRIRLTPDNFGSFCHGTMLGLICCLRPESSWHAIVPRYHKPHELVEKRTLAVCIGNAFPFEC